MLDFPFPLAMIFCEEKQEYDRQMQLWCWSYYKKLDIVRILNNCIEKDLLFLLNIVSQANTQIHRLQTKRTQTHRSIESKQRIKNSTEPNDARENKKWTPKYDWVWSASIAIRIHVLSIVAHCTAFDATAAAVCLLLSSLICRFHSSFVWYALNCLSIRLAHISVAATPRVCLFI